MSLADITDRWRACSACALRRTCRQPIVGEAWSRGEIYDAPALLVVGSAPRGRDDSLGRPFMDDAGKLLRDEILAPAEVRLAYLTTAVACRTLGMDPQPGEVAACSARLAELAAAMAPAAVLFVGPFAERVLGAAPWAASIPKMAVADPAAIIARGHPTEATKKTVSAQVAKVRRLLTRAGAPPRPKRPKDAPVEEVLAGCAHAHDTIGVWRGRDASTPMIGCYLCAELRKTATPSTR